VAKKHAQAHTLASHTTKAHSELTGVTANQHHTKYTDAEAKAAAVQSGAITNGVTKAPTHDAVYDVKVTADTATTPAEVDAKITTHKGDASAHHAKYTNTEAQSTVKANVEVGDLKAPTKALAMNSQKITGLLAPTATGDALRKGTRVTITELPAMTDEKIWKGTGGNVEEVDMPTGEAGEGHITILPFNYNSIGQGTWALVDGAGAYWGEWQWRNTTNANADNITYKVYLAEGTYTLALLVAKHGNAPIVDVDIAGVEKASFDLYAAVQANNTRVTQTAIAMTAGLKDLRIRVDGKHGSSGGYQFNLQAIALWRTA